MMKRIFALLVAAVLSLTLAPAAFAEDDLTDAELKARIIINLFEASTEYEDFPGDERGTWLALQDYFAKIIEEDPGAYEELINIWKNSADIYSGFGSRTEFDDTYSTHKKNKVGITVHFREDGCYVVGIEKNSPAEVAGVKINTKMTHFQGIPLPMDRDAGMALLSELYSKTGVYAFTGFLPDGTPCEYSITPGDYDVDAAAGICEVTGNTGYIALRSGFYADTAEKFARAWKAAETAGVRSVIIDLRDNMGGFDTTSWEMLSTVISEKVPISYYRMKNGFQFQITLGSGSKTFKPDIVILTNENSASAAEVFTEVLRYHGYARSVGTKTYGKAIGQRPIELPGENLFTVTAFSLYLPDGSTYQDEGLIPDAEVVDDPETEVDEVLEFAYSYVDNAGKPHNQPSALRFTINLETKDEKFPLSCFAAAKRLSDEAGMPVYLTFKASDGTKVTVDAAKVFNKAQEEYSFGDMLK
ncbi:MAG: S41 family peptidase [Ruminococcus sp.]|jgi:C-terminal peptidase prc|nr:S41 family peptidase [Ruminococcus sp.]